MFNFIKTIGTIFNIVDPSDRRVFLDFIYFYLFWLPQEWIVLGQPKRTGGEGRTFGGWVVLGDQMGRKEEGAES